MAKFTWFNSMNVMMDEQKNKEIRKKCDKKYIFQTYLVEIVVINKQQKKHTSNTHTRDRSVWLFFLNQNTLMACLFCSNLYLSLSLCFFFLQNYVFQKVSRLANAARIACQCCCVVFVIG